jgi:hypothetical protein
MTMTWSPSKHKLRLFHHNSLGPPGIGGDASFPQSDINVARELARFVLGRVVLRSEGTY